ncbi:MAG: helix-turn-helix domain-containing protein [Bacteroidia bacterium]|nr:helix-turn-helix domain-containing protein [Bacteroidia bacterium]
MNLQNPEIIAKIGAKLKRLRIEKGYTSYENFAMDFDLSRAYYWKVERGQQNLSMDYFLSLLKIHEISLKDFFSDID